MGQCSSTHSQKQSSMAKTNYCSPTEIEEKRAQKLELEKQSENIENVASVQKDTENAGPCTNDLPDNWSFVEIGCNDSDNQVTTAVQDQISQELNLLRSQINRSQLVLNALQAKASALSGVRKKLTNAQKHTCQLFQSDGKEIADNLAIELLQDSEEVSSNPSSCAPATSHVTSIHTVVKNTTTSSTQTDSEQYYSDKLSNFLAKQSTKKKRENFFFQRGVFGGKQTVGASEISESLPGREIFNRNRSWSFLTAVSTGNLHAVNMEETETSVQPESLPRPADPAAQSFTPKLPMASSEAVDIIQSPSATNVDNDNRKLSLSTLTEEDSIGAADVSVIASKPPTYQPPPDYSLSTTSVSRNSGVLYSHRAGCGLEKSQSVDAGIGSREDIPIRPPRHRSADRAKNNSRREESPSFEIGNKRPVPQYPSPPQYKRVISERKRGTSQDRTASSGPQEKQFRKSGSSSELTDVVVEKRSLVSPSIQQHTDSYPPAVSKSIGICSTTRVSSHSDGDLQRPPPRQSRHSQGRCSSSSPTIGSFPRSSAFDHGTETELHVTKIPMRKCGASPQTRIGETAETSETESARNQSGGSQDSEDATVELRVGLITNKQKLNDGTAVFPTITDTFLNKLNLSQQDFENSQQMSAKEDHETGREESDVDFTLSQKNLRCHEEQPRYSCVFSTKEIENMFNSLALAFKTDGNTLSRRRELQQRSRDNTEKNIEDEVHSIKTMVKATSDILREVYKLRGDSDVVRTLMQLQSHVEVLELCIQRLSGRAELFGAVQQEARISNAVDVMVRHVEHLTEQRQKDIKGLQEARNLLLANKIVLPPVLQWAGDGVMKDTLSPDHSDLSRRRSSSCVDLRNMDADSDNLTKAGSSDHTTARTPAMSLNENIRKIAPATAFDSSFVSYMRRSASVDLNYPRINLKNVSNLVSTSPPPEGDATMDTASVASYPSKTSASPHHDDCNIPDVEKQNNEVFQRGFEEGVKTRVENELVSLKEKQVSLHSIIDDLLSREEEVEEQASCTQAIREKILAQFVDRYSIMRMLRFFISTVLLLGGLVFLIFTFTKKDDDSSTG